MSQIPNKVKIYGLPSLFDLVVYGNQAIPVTTQSHTKAAVSNSLPQYKYKHPLQLSQGIAGSRAHVEGLTKTIWVWMVHVTQTKRLRGLFVF